jgi:hypothetical protein
MADVGVAVHGHPKKASPGPAGRQGDEGRRVATPAWARLPGCGLGERGRGPAAAPAPRSQACEDGYMVKGGGADGVAVGVLDGVGGSRVQASPPRGASAGAPGRFARGCARNRFDRRTPARAPCAGWSTGSGTRAPPAFSAGPPPDHRPPPARAQGSPLSVARYVETLSANLAGALELPCWESEQLRVRPPWRGRGRAYGGAGRAQAEGQAGGRRLHLLAPC